MTLEEKLKKALIKLMFDYYEHGTNMHTIVPDSDTKTIIEICQQEIDEACKKARLEEHKETVLYWETLPRNELYGIDYHFNRIRELSPKESE